MSKLSAINILELWILPVMLQQNGNILSSILSIKDYFNSVDYFWLVYFSYIKENQYENSSNKKSSVKTILRLLHILNNENSYNIPIVHKRMLRTYRNSYAKVVYDKL